MAAAAVRRGLPRQVSGSLVQQLRSLYTSSSTLLQQPIGAAAAAASQFRRALLIARGDFTVFLTQPISAALLVMTAVAVIAVASPSLRKRRDEALQE